ncbi:hypothetical protein ACFL2C_02290 [Patescibacteria group bacterium]
MADASPQVLKALWNETEDDTWGSLLYALDEIYENEVLDYKEYKDLKWAISKCVSNGYNFPDSIGELSSLLDPYM